MVGKSADGVTNGAGSLASGGVKIITVGIGGLFDGSQLSTMATLPSYKLNSISFIKLLSISRSTSSLISQGTYIFFATPIPVLGRSLFNSEEHKRFPNFDTGRPDQRLTPMHSTFIRKKRNPAENFKLKKETHFNKCHYERCRSLETLSYTWVTDLLPQHYYTFTHETPFSTV